MPKNTLFKPFYTLLMDKIERLDPSKDETNDMMCALLSCERPLFPFSYPDSINNKILSLLEKVSFDEISEGEKRSGHWNLWLHYALKIGANSKLVKKLLDLGCNPNFTTPNWPVALKVAADSLFYDDEETRKDILALLESYGAH